jgi:hypothetical protein
VDAEFHREQLDTWEQRLERAYEVSTLPADPPVEELHRFLIALRLEGKERG